MFDDLKDMFRYAAKDTVSFMADWRLYAGASIFVGVVSAAIYLDHGLDEEVVVVVLAFVGIAVGITLAMLRWREGREMREWAERRRREIESGE